MSETNLTREQIAVLDEVALLATDRLLYMPARIGEHSRARALVRRGLLESVDFVICQETWRTGRAYRLTRVGMAACSEVAP